MPPQDALETTRAGANARAQGRWTRLLVTAASMAVVLGSLAWAVRHNSDATAIDLMDELDRAAKDSPLGLHRAFDLVEEAISGTRRPAIFAHPLSRITWDVDVPAHSGLRTHLALAPGIWEQTGDGVTFRIGVTDGPTYRELYARHVNPKDRLEDRAWIPVHVDLSAYAGHRVALVLETSPGPANNPFFDWALWGTPRIVRAR